LLVQVGLEEKRHTHRPGKLSGGQQQRVAIARALANNPSVILADEPTGNLDPQLAIDMLTLFEEIHETGTTVLFATHDHSLLQSAPHRLVVIDDGRLIEASHGLRAWSARTQNAAAKAPEKGEQDGALGYGVARAARSAR
jgi:cell division transport system ATP-binding protein